MASRDGREVRYRASTGAAQDASTWLSVRASAWDRRLAALEKDVRDAQAFVTVAVAAPLSVIDRQFSTNPGKSGPFRRSRVRQGKWPRRFALEPYFS